MTGYEYFHEWLLLTAKELISRLESEVSNRLKLWSLDDTWAKLFLTDKKQQETIEELETSISDLKDELDRLRYQVS